MFRVVFTVVSVLFVPCLSWAQRIIDDTIIDNTPFDPGTHNPFSWIPKPQPYGSTFGVDPDYSSELTLKNFTGSTLSFDVTVFQRGIQPIRLPKRTLNHAGTTTWSAIGMSDISLVSVRGSRPGSSVESLSKSIRPTNRRTRSYGGGGASPGSVVIAQDVVLTGQAATFVDFSGEYNSRKGFVRFAQNGDHVNGIVTYTNGNRGVIAGRVRGNRLEYQWQNQALSGTGVLTMNPDGSLSGSGSDNQGGTFSWNLWKR